MSLKLNINSHASVVMTARLERMRRSALPNAIRGALNGAAFDTKQNTMPKSASSKFVMRAPNFFKANSKVEKATGWDVNGMKATIGFTPSKGRGADWAVKDLEEQEKGGSIEKKAFIPMNNARGGAPSKRVMPSNRLSAVKQIINSSTVSGVSPRQKFRHAATMAGPGGFVLGNNAKKTLWKIESVNGGIIKKKPLYSYRAGRSVSVKGTGFMKSASLESGGKIEQLYIKEAKRIIEK